MPQRLLTTVFCAWAGLSALLPAARAAHFPFPTAHTQDRAQGDALYQQAFSAYESGDYAQALSLIEKADALKPDQSDGWNLRGMVYLKQNAFDKAEAAFARAVKIDPKLWAAQFNLAEASFQGKDYARARARFEKLLDQTDRFKETKEWELVQFKVYMCCLLMGDDATATRQLGKLHVTGGVTPAYLYAQAALAFSRKDATGARKSMATAQTTFSPLLNDLFSNSLIEVGWVTPVAPPPGMLAVGNGTPLPPGPLPTYSQAAGNQTPIVIDPRLEAAVAEPLPSPDAGVHPVMSKVSGAPVRSVPKTAAVSPTPLPVAPTPVEEIASEHRGLLLE